MPDVVTARAGVATVAPERYAEQLVSHRGRTTEFSVVRTEPPRLTAGRPS